MHTDYPYQGNWLVPHHSTEVAASCTAWVPAILDVVLVHFLPIGNIQISAVIPPQPSLSGGQLWVATATARPCNHTKLALTFSITHQPYSKCCIYVILQALPALSRPSHTIFLHRQQSCYETVIEHLSQYIMIAAATPDTPHSTGPLDRLSVTLPV
jgi:hypothetical protein